MANGSWCCTVCGYLHRGDSPPECCPVCGATPDLFEAAAAEQAAPVKDVPHQWRCLNCDYLHEGDAPPDACPVCGVGPDQFEPVTPAEQNSPSLGTTGSIVVVGGGIAGLSAAEAARSAAPRATVTIVTREPELPYYRLNLTRYLAGEITDGDLPIHPESWYADHGITVLLETEVTSIDTTGKSLRLKGSPDLAYDRLILAMGAHPSVPAIPGVNRENVATLRTRRDAEWILGHCSAGARCVIVGGGILGLETAAALARRQVHVSLLEGFEWLLPRQLNRAASERLAAQARALGIDLVCGACIRQFDGDERVRSVVLDSGQAITADLVIMAAGVRSNSYLARLAGLSVSDGVVVDNQLRTSDPHIYAAGDLAEHQGIAYGTWAPSQFQGTIAGMNAAGGEVSFAGIPRSNILKVLGVDMFSIGQVHPEDASYRLFEENGDHYDLFVFRDSRMVGAILVGDTTIAPAIKKLIETHASCADLLAAATDARDIRAGMGNVI